MILILNGNLEIGVHLFLCYLICFGHFIKSSTVTIRILFLWKDLSSFMRVQHVLNYHLINKFHALKILTLPWISVKSWWSYLNRKWYYSFAFHEFFQIWYKSFFFISADLGCQPILHIWSSFFYLTKFVICHEATQENYHMFKK